MLKIDRTMLPCTISTDGNIQKNVNPANGTDFKCDELQLIVGGYFEIIYLHGGDEGLIMVLNEEGKLMDLDNNILATALARKAKAIYPNDYIAGNILICDTKMIK